MKRILIRCAINPLEEISIADTLNLNLIGDNSGNLIYANSIYRSLMVDDQVEFVCDNYRLNANDSDWINENFDSYIIPLADLFRKENKPEINRMKNLVKKLTIPCVVIGVGLRANSKKDIENGFEFDDCAKEFINAVLEKSATIGLRGEITAEYFKKLGYKEDKDFTVIGCPSMYTYGNKLKRKELLLNEDSRISVNSSVLSSANTLNFLNNIFDNYKNSYFIPQRIDELWTLYSGKEYKFLSNKPMYPNKITDKIYQQNRVKMFLQAKQWMEFLSTMDLSIGSRMHGNIAAIQAGTPSIIIPHGTRMTELINYHKLPNITSESLKKCKNLSDVIERVDFDSMYKCHEENFARYKKFLEINGVNTIFKNTDYVENAPYDTALSKIDTDFEIKSVVSISHQELSQRWVGIYDSNNKIKQDLKNDLKALNSQFNLLNKSSIKRDVMCLTVKICDKIKGEKHTNIERVLKIKEKTNAKK